MLPSQGRLRLLAAALAITLTTACGSQRPALRPGGQGSSTTAPFPPFTTGADTVSWPPPATTVTAGSPATAGRPSTTATVGQGSGVSASVVFGPVCPVERVPPDPQCAPRPGPADVQLVRADGGVAAEGHAGPEGRVTVSAQPGRYAVRASAAAPGPGRGCQVEPAQVTVSAGSFASVAVTCDTGIR